MSSLSINQVVGRFRRKKPKDVSEALHQCHVPIQYMFSGAYRDVYHIVGTPLVAKFPVELEVSDEYCGETGRDHSETEAKWIRRLLKPKYRSVHKYLPKLYHFDPTNGVILMQKYREVRDTVKNRNVCDLLGQHLIAELNLAEEPDIKPDNLGLDEDGNMVILDFGCFTL